MSPCGPGLETWGSFWVDPGLHEGVPSRECEAGGDGADVREDVLAGALGGPGVDPGRFEAAADQPNPCWAETWAAERAELREPNG